MQSQILHPEDLASESKVTIGDVVQDHMQYQSAAAREYNSLADVLTRLVSALDIPISKSVLLELLSMLSTVSIVVTPP